jgi:hypothetical protein
MPKTTLLAALAKQLNKFHPSHEEAVTVWGQLAIAIGCSIAGIPVKKCPRTKELLARYQASPSLGIAMIITGMTVLSWVETLKEPSVTEGNEIKDMEKHE